MKHIPNLVTLLNLMFGCLAITAIMGVHPSLAAGEDGFIIQGMEQLYWGSIFIGIAAIMDVFDGLAARALNAHSSIGGQLDSLADLVSFGVAPGMILYQLLWRAYMMEPGAMSTPTWVLIPAFALPCAAALRLAKFNNTATEQKYFFRGMPTPAVGLLIASFPLILLLNPVSAAAWMTHRWVIYLTIILCCYLLLCTTRFVKWKGVGIGITAWWPQLFVVIGSGIAAIFAGWYAVPIGFGLYILGSLLYRYPKEVVDPYDEDDDADGF